MSSRLSADAFEFYVSLGPERSYAAVAEKYGVSKRAVTAFATKESWQRRIGEIERKARVSADAKAVESLEDMKLRHLRSLKVIQGKALEVLRNMSLKSAMDAVRALDLAIKQERLIHGEPSERTALSIEEVVRDEHRRWIQDRSATGSTSSPDAIPHQEEGEDSHGEVAAAE
jgi:hypothetical protein